MAAEEVSAGLQAYPAYKDSGVAWIGEIPVGWEVRRIKEMTRFEVGGTPPTNETEHFEGDLPWVTIADMQGDDLGDTKLRLTSEAVHKYRIPLVKKGDLLLSFKLSVGKTAFAPCDLYTNEAIATFSRTEQMDLRYLYYVLPRAVLESAGENIYGAKILNQRLIKSTPLPVPPRKDQPTIAAFLNRETDRIDELLREQGLLLEELGLKRKTTSSEAVTRGIDPSVALKESGVPWIGQISDSWELARLKQVVELLQTGPFGSQIHVEDYQEDGIPLINPSQIRNGRLVENTSTAVSPVKALELKRHTLREGDIVFARRGDMGRVGLVTAQQAGWLCGTGSLLMRLNQQQVDPKFMLFWLSTPMVKAFLELVSVGSTMDNLNTTIVGNLETPLPPLPEQRAITEHLEAQLAQIDALTEEVRASMTLMRQHRAALITAAVTGKIDVRNHA